MESFINMIRLMFLWRVLLLSVKNIYKRVAIARLIYHLYGVGAQNVHMGPLSIILNICKQFNLIEMVQESIEGGSYLTLKILLKQIYVKQKSPSGYVHVYYTRS